jgi:hypothetical protein
LKTDRTPRLFEPVPDVREELGVRKQDGKDGLYGEGVFAGHGRPFGLSDERVIGTSFVSGMFV